MNIKGIISISGKPGLHKVVSQTKNGLIAESLIDNKRFPVYSTQQISALEDISIYTNDEDILLSEVFESLKKIENGKATISHKASATELSAKLEEALPNYDKERVYASDIKKLIQWYNVLVETGLLDAAAEDEEAKEDTKASKDKKAKASKDKKATDDKPSSAKATEDKKDVADKKGKKKEPAKAITTAGKEKKVAKAVKEESKKAAPKKTAAKTKTQPKKSTGSK